MSPVRGLVDPISSYAPLELDPDRKFSCTHGSFTARPSCRLSSTLLGCRVADCVRAAQGAHGQHHPEIAAACRPLLLNACMCAAGSLTASGQPKARMGNITLKMLLDEGLVLPGENNLVSEYKGVTQLASLRPDGRIACIVRSPSSLAALRIGLQVVTGTGILRVVSGGTARSSLRISNPDSCTACIVRSLPSPAALCPGIQQELRTGAHVSPRVIGPDGRIACIVRSPHPARPAALGPGGRCSHKTRRLHRLHRALTLEPCCSQFG